MGAGGRMHAAQPLLEFSVRIKAFDQEPMSSWLHIGGYEGTDDGVMRQRYLAPLFVKQ